MIGRLARSWPTNRDGPIRACSGSPDNPGYADRVYRGRRVLGVLLICCLPALDGCGAGGERRTEELWVIDFYTLADEIASTILSLDLDHDR